MIRFIEINYVPLLRSAFPDETLYVDTRLSWEDGRGHEEARSSLGSRLAKLWNGAVEALRIPTSSGVEAVVVRSRGPENAPSFGPGYLMKRFLGKALHVLAIHLSRKHRCKLAVVDRADEAAIHPNDHWILKHCDIYFKRELPWSVWSAFELIKPERICIGTASASPALQKLAGKLEPLSLGIEDHLVASGPDRPREPLYDIFYMGKSYGMERRLMVEEGLAACESAGLRVFRASAPLAREEFLGTIRSSRIAISPGGVGWDCFRHYEIPSCGTPMLIERPSHHTHRPPRENVEAIYYDPHQPILPLILEWIGKNHDLTKLGEAGRTWALNHHSYSALGRKIEKTLLRKEIL